MLKKILLAGTVLSFAAVASFALPATSVEAKGKPMTCKAWAKAKYPKSLMKRHKAMKTCKAAYKAKMKKK
jgi:hypothetical protein